MPPDAPFTEAELAAIERWAHEDQRGNLGQQAVVQKAGLPAHYTLHSLRHTFGSGLISLGVSPAYVQQQRGHASIEQTVGTYGSWFPVRVPGAVDALAEATAPAALGHQMDTWEVSATAEAR